MLLVLSLDHFSNNFIIHDIFLLTAWLLHYLLWFIAGALCPESCHKLKHDYSNIGFIIKATCMKHTSKSLFFFFFLIELATQFRLELIKAKALSVLENLITKVIDIYKLMEKWLGERYLNEMSRYSSAWLFCKHTLWNPVSRSQIPFTNTSVDPLGRLVCKPMKGAFT